MMTPRLLLAALLVLPVACTGDKVTASGGSGASPSAPTAAAEPAPAGAEPAAPMVEPASPPKITLIKGKVLEKVDASDYSYLKLQVDKEQVWAAVMRADVKVGQEVEVESQMFSPKFTSPSLKRDFEKVHFGTLKGAPGAQPTAAADQGSNFSLPSWAVPPKSGASGASGTALPPGHPSMESGTQNAAATAPAPAKPAARLTPGTVTKISSVYASRASLVGKQVTIKGKVVKFTSGVMGKNWVHVQDGSGAEAKKDNDLAITTQDSAKVGDTVTAVGVLRSDVDIGAGYHFDLLLEDASLQN